MSTANKKEKKHNRREQSNRPLANMLYLLPSRIIIRSESDMKDSDRDSESESENESESESENESETERERETWKTETEREREAITTLDDYQKQCAKPINFDIT
jgi:hypothetical protein